VSLGYTLLVPLLGGLAGGIRVMCENDELVS